MEAVQDIETDDAAAPAEPASISRPQGKPIDYIGAGKRLMERCVKDATNNQARLDRDRSDWQNHLFYRGGRDNHWSVYDRATNSYVPRGNDPEKGGLPEWVPRAVTNVFATKIDGIVSILDQSEPAKMWAPATDDDEDRAAAEVAGDADPALLEEIGYDSLRSEAHKLIALTNGCAFVLYYDNDPKHGMEDIPLLRCPTCGVETTPMAIEDAGNVCPPELDEQGQEVEAGCGTPLDQFEPVINADGTPKGIPYAKGKICCALVPSFEYSLPSSARVADSKRNAWVLTHSDTPREEILARWPKAKDVVERHGSRKTGGIQKAYARQMRQLSSPNRAHAMGSSQGDGHTVYILHHDPIDDGDLYFPDGFYGVMVEDQLLEHGPLPVRDDDDRPVKNVLIRSFAHAPGSAFGKPPADDLVPLQISRNLVESLIQLILMHDAAPTTYIPISITLENKRTGRPGEDVYYRSTTPGDKPFTERGVNPPEGLYKYLEMIDAKFEEISKLNAVLGGVRPEGDPTLGEVTKLEENGMRAFKEPLDQLVRFERDLSLMLLWIARQSAWSDRIRRIRGENGSWEIRQFNAADLSGKVDVQIDKQSAWPKSPLMRMLRVGKALEMGVLMPPAQDPELQTKLLTEMDLTTLKPSMDADRKQVARELDRWKAAHDPSEIAPPDPTTQELPLHLHFKKQFLKTEEFELLRTENAPLADAMIAHVTQIQAVLQAQAAAALAAENPQPPDSRTPAEKGDGSAVEEAVASGALSPAGAQPKADPMAEAMAAGALTPASAVPPPAAGPSIDDLIEAGALAPAPPEVPRGQ